MKILASVLCLVAILLALRFTGDGVPIRDQNAGNWPKKEQVSAATESQIPSGTKESADAQREKEFLAKAVSILANAKIKDQEFAEWKKKFNERMPYRAAIRKKTIQNDAQISGYLLETWGSTKKQVEKVCDVVTKRDIALYDLRQKRLSESDVTLRLSLSDESRKIESDSKAALIEILGGETALAFESWESSKRKKSISRD
jgi:hypothetical protein